MTINPKDNYVAVVNTTAGSFTMDLFASQDPVAVNNFVFLSNQHFYDGDKFFRVLPSFVIQTGDPYNDGTGGPGYTWPAELPVPFPYQPGIVAMAVSDNNPNTNGSQFFICTGPESVDLNKDPIYTEVGRVVKGWSTIETIEKGRVTVNPVTNEKSYPIHPYAITAITIHVSAPSS
jgi:cyclophilin family peptidyl-prolyl cis-trans isomerase